MKEVEGEIKGFDINQKPLWGEIFHETEDDLLMLIFEGLLDEVFASKCQGVLYIEIHEHLKIVMAESLLDTIHDLK